MINNDILYDSVQDFFILQIRDSGKDYGEFEMPSMANFCTEKMHSIRQAFIEFEKAAKYFSKKKNRKYLIEKLKDGSVLELELQYFCYNSNGKFELTEICNQWIIESF